MLRRIKRVLVVLVLILIVLGLFNIDRFVPINEVSCTSQFGPCNEEVKQEIETVRGKSLRDSKKRLKEMLSGLDRIGEFGFKYVFPTKMEVNINEIKPEVAVKNDNEDNYKLINSKGKLVGDVSETLLPLIEVNRDLNEAEYEYSAQILLSLNDLYGIRTIRVIDNYLRAELPSGYEVLMSMDGDIDVLLGSLRLILFQLNEKPQEFRINTIDLRYKNPVIK